MSDANPNAERDHDLLVRLDTKLDALTASLNDMRLQVSLKADSTRVDKLETSRVDKLELALKEKADSVRLDKLEATRVEKLEKTVEMLSNKFYYAMGAFGALQFTLQLALHFLKL
jgi:nicotinate-nucleotide pyrophosphorylase